MAAEGRLRQGGEARSFETRKEDQGTTAAVGASFGLALVAGPVLALSRRGRFPTRLGWAGVGVMTVGLALRVAASRALGSHYTRTLRTADDQPVVTNGPYRYVRHPGYAGVLLLWFGYGLALTSLPATLVTSVPNLVAYRRRINAEETMLIEALGAPYREYQRSTKRLVPGLY
jgi:protein-S-isoprenylcysteine O-methyltransferase Ste14